ncbi:MAG: methyl-accepting chemotaxis protein [Oscillospiraceae bacterium]|nr:methyl-accepting chemotaxis protein [Oscillospiraceae bacterium]
MKNTKTIRSKIFSGFIIILSIGIVLGGAGIISVVFISGISGEFHEIQETSKNIQDVLDAHYSWRQELTLSVMNGEDFTGALDPSACALGKFLSSPEARSIGDGEVLNLLSKIKEPHDYIHTNAVIIQSSISSGNLEEAKRYLNENILPETAETINILSNITGRYADLSEEASERLIFFEYVMIAVISSLLFIALITGIILSVIITKGIEKELKRIIQNLAHLSKNISVSAAQLSEASDSLSTGASGQAASIEETSSTLNEASSMVAQNAENTKTAAGITETALSEVGEAGKYMTILMNTMTELKSSSDKVGKIIQTIDDIAFQTNLLAINATIEAARAGGDAGRSFAVVAQEVRNLAQKSASSSSETSEIIEKNINLTDSSRREAEQVMVLATSNAANIANLAKLVSEISVASEEQAAGIKQINIAVSQMEKATQESAAVAQETSASANSLRDEGQNLEELIAEALSMLDKNN